MTSEIHTELLWQKRKMRRKSCQAEGINDRNHPSNNGRDIVIYFIEYIFSSSQAKLEARLVERGGQFFAGNHLTWADLHVFKFLDELRIANDIKVNREYYSKKYVLHLLLSKSYFQFPNTNFTYSMSSSIHF